MIIRYEVKWVTAQPLIEHVDRPDLLTTRIIEEGVPFPTRQGLKGTKEHPLIAPIATNYFLDEGCIVFHKNSADFVTFDDILEHQSYAISCGTLTKRWVERLRNVQHSSNALLSWLSEQTVCNLFWTILGARKTCIGLDTSGRGNWPRTGRNADYGLEVFSRQFSTYYQLYRNGISLTGRFAPKMFRPWTVCPLDVSPPRRNGRFGPWLISTTKAKVVRLQGDIARLLSISSVMSYHRRHLGFDRTGNSAIRWPRKPHPITKNEVDRKTGRCEDMAFRIFQDGGRSPSWIWSNRK